MIKLKFCCLALISTVLLLSSKANNVRGTNNECKYYIAVYQYEQNRSGPDQIDFCEVNGRMVEIVGLTNEFKQLNKADLKSGRTKIIAPGSVILNGKFQIPVHAQQDLIIEPEYNTEHGQRRRLTVSGTKKVFVIRADGLDTTTTSDKETISNKVFGTGDDKVNLRSQFAACSYNQVDFMPYTGTTSTGESIENGVGEVNIFNSVNGTSSDVIMMAMLEVAWEKYGDLQQFDHIMLCLPPGTTGSWIAYAFVNSWLSVYNDDWCIYPSAQMHEMGHNLGLGHSGDGTLEYGDQSCLMGYSYSLDENPVMCFNGAKSWQLGWYEESGHVIINQLNSSFTGRLIGVADYGHLKKNDKVVVKIEGLKDSIDYFVAFNRKVGINSETLIGGNMILVTSIKAGTDNDYSHSTLKAIIDVGGKYTISNFDQFSDMIVKVHNISFSVSPEIASYAEISIGLTTDCSSNSDCEDEDSCTLDKCIIETGKCKNLRLPCSSCGAIIRVQITTDNYPSETSWNVKEISEETTMVFSGGGYSSVDHMFTDSKCLKFGSYKFVINDDFGDGICCSTGDGSYKLSVRDKVIKIGGSFTYEEVTPFQIVPQKKKKIVTQPNTTLLPINISDIISQFDLNETQPNTTLLPINITSQFDLNNEPELNTTFLSIKHFLFHTIELFYKYIAKYQSNSYTS